MFSSGEWRSGELGLPWFEWGIYCSTICTWPLANLKVLHPYSVLLIIVVNIQRLKSIDSGTLTHESISSTEVDNIPNHNTRLSSLIYIWNVEAVSCKPYKAQLSMHPPWLYATSCAILPIILLHLILHLLFLHSVPHSTTFLSFLQHMVPMHSRVRNYCSQKKEEACLARALAFKKMANRYCPYDVCLPIVSLHVS